MEPFSFYAAFKFLVEAVLCPLRATDYPELLSEFLQITNY